MLNELAKLHGQHIEQLLYGRYITQQMIAPLLEKHKSNFVISVIGYSVKNQPIHSIKIGTGKTKVLMWSQMHGNESTTTKALFDFINLCAASGNTIKNLTETCTLLIIPILNPDGAELYTRVNANGIDLNRDAQDLSQPESQVLWDTFNAFKPDYCFNLHGQRTIFGAGSTGESSTLSFLAPAQDPQRLVTETRQKAMSVIVAITSELQKDLPKAIGRYDDGFNINCVGDTFQSLNVPTILFEAGHYKTDYNREQTRLFIFKSLFLGLNAIANGLESYNLEDYFKIPENEKNFNDVIIVNARLTPESKDTCCITIQFKEELRNGSVAFIPIVEKITPTQMGFGHKIIDANGQVVLNHKNNAIRPANEIDFVMLKNKKILIKP
jgi:hypothetical protein